MEAHLEALVGNYLTCGGAVFISPQFSVPWDKEQKDGGSCPDFVALDFEKKQVVVVEVTTAADISSLLAKIPQRKANWFDPIERKLRSTGAIPVDPTMKPQWEFRFLGIVRDKVLANARHTFEGVSDVTFHPLEEAVLGYAYFDTRAKGLP